MKKLMMIAVLAGVATASFAEGGNGGKGGGNGFMKNLTDEQKACLDAQNCPKTEKPQFEKGPKPDGKKTEKGSKPEMTAEQKAERECMKKAMETCGIEKPERNDEKNKKQKPQE